MIDSRASARKLKYGGRGVIS